MTPSVPFNAPHLFVEEAFDFLKDALQHGAISGDGPNTKFCVEWFAERFGYERALLTPSCTAALEMTALLLDLQPGDEVIVPSYTFVSTANAFALRGVQLQFADSSFDTPNVSIDSILSLVTERTKAIVVVHYAGVPLDLRPLLVTGIPLIEDCAHAIGAFDPYTQRPIGLAGCMSAFSFHQTKNIPIGEGGMLVVNDPQLWERAQIVREKGTNRTRFIEGRDTFYTWHSLGSSYLLSDIDAAFLRASLNHFDEIQEKRSAIWKGYDRDLLVNSLYKKPKLTVSLANAHMYYLKFSSWAIQQSFCDWMKKNSVLVTTHYVPLEESPFIAARETPGGATCPMSRNWHQTLVRLPLFFALTEANQNFVIKCINEFSEHHGFVLQAVLPEHYEGIRLIRNENREAFLHTEEIDPETHGKFMKLHSQTYRVAYHEGNMVGFVGHVDGDFRIACVPSQQRKGLAHFMYSTFLEEYPFVSVRVKRSNVKSWAFFKKLGYKPEPSAFASGEDPLPLILG
jgi:dTDP-4-amino-4,6-dideoxygalactose transaminase